MPLRNLLQFLQACLKGMVICLDTGRAVFILRIEGSYDKIGLQFADKNVAELWRMSEIILIVLREFCFHAQSKARAHCFLAIHLMDQDSAQLCDVAIDGLHTCISFPS